MCICISLLHRSTMSWWWKWWSVGLVWPSWITMGRSSGQCQRPETVDLSGMAIHLKVLLGFLLLELLVGLILHMLMCTPCTCCCTQYTVLPCVRQQDFVYRYTVVHVHIHCTSCTHTLYSKYTYSVHHIHCFMYTCTVLHVHIFCTLCTQTLYSYMPVFQKFPAFWTIFTLKKHPGFSEFLPLSKSKEKNPKESDRVIVNSDCTCCLRGIPLLDLYRLVVSGNIVQSKSKLLFQHRLCVTYLSPESGIFTTTLPVHWHDSDVGNRIVVKQAWMRRESTWAHQVLGLPCTF